MPEEASRENPMADEPWIMVSKRPEPANAPWIVDVQGYQEFGAPKVVRRELPSAIIPLILVLGEGFSLHDEAGFMRDLRQSFVAGLTERHVLIGSSGNAACLQINLTPPGARRLFRIDMHDIAGRVLDLRGLLGVEVELLAEELAETRGWMARLMAFEQFVAAKIGEAQPACGLAAAAGNAITGSGGAVSISALAENLGISRKHLHNRFRQEFGLAPKSFARIVRFQSALAGLEHGTCTSLADLAAACGYADQAHFNRDFRAFSGVSPRVFMAQRLPDGSVGIPAG